MGLDLLEFCLKVEETFHFRFPDEDAAKLATPRLLIDYLTAHLPTSEQFVCPTQHVFYRLRSSLSARLGCPRSALRPDTSLLELVPESGRSALWKDVRRDCDLPGGMRWPRLAGPGWLDFCRSPRVDTLGEATRLIARQLPGPSKVIAGHEMGWTRAEVAAVVHGLIQQELGLSRGEYTENSRWWEDMRVS